MTAFGFEPMAFRLDSTVHPFCSSFATTDVRVTTRYAESDLESLFSCMHEIGHGLYERGVSPSLERTPLAAGCSSGLHESQSRLWENVIGRSLPFCRWLHPQLVATFPDALGHMSAEDLHAAINCVKPSLHPRRRGRGHLRHAHHPPVRARAGADRGDALDRRSAGGVECPVRGVPRDPRHRRPARRAAGRALVVGPVRLLPDLPARQRDERADLGGGAGRAARASRSALPRASSASSATGCARTSTRSAAS